MQTDWTSLRLPRKLVERLHALAARRNLAAMARNPALTGKRYKGLALHTFLELLTDAYARHLDRAARQHERRKAAAAARRAEVNGGPEHGA